MVEINLRIAVRDFDEFWTGFRDRGAPLRERHGSQGARVLRSLDDPNGVTVVLRFAERAGFDAFMQDPEVQDSMVRGGVRGRPDIVVLREIGELPA
jgi:heme-degrading monooxygenase HmoA